MDPGELMVVFSPYEEAPVEGRGAVAENAIEVVARRLRRGDLHLGRAFRSWVHHAYSRRQMPRKLADYFERGAPAANIPSSVLTSYAAVAKRYLEQPHCPTGLRVQALRLQRLRRELGRRLSARSAAR